MHNPTGQHCVILKEGPDRYLPIWIGGYEANAIALKVAGIVPERPPTHDLMVEIMAQFNIGLDRIVVTEISNEVFHARLHLRQDGREFNVDARPSDAIALAVRCECPILVHADVLDKAGVEHEKKEEEAGAEEADAGRLTVFRDLVNSLELPDLPDEPPR